MKDLINDTRKYWNQYYDVTDLPETVKNEKTRTCNVTCLAMITGKHPDEILQDMFDKYGKNDQFQWEEHLVDYLEERGFKCEAVTKLAYPAPRHVTVIELEKMKLEVIGGKVILYHKKGHYQIMVGYDFKDGEYFIFNDPAGDRNFPSRYRKRESGHNVKYGADMIKNEIIYGRCWAVTI